MDKTKSIQEVEKLIAKAGESKTADEAMKYSQAALNAANAIAVSDR